MSEKLADIAGKPVFFERNRVFRVYTGGKLFRGFFGDAGEDGFWPEEWIASSVRALNRDSRNPREGLSKVRGADVYFSDLIEAQRERMLGDRENLGILVKVLDSAVRLPVQAHPDKAFSREHFQSGFGKSEAWIILATRENAAVYFGFSGQMTRERFLDAVDRSQNDKDAMEALLNRLPAKTGDVYFIPPKAVHAIGCGCLILEVQEPTDFTIQPEAWCGDYPLSDYEKYLGLDPDTALSCFDYSLFGKAAVELGKKQPRITRDAKGIVSESLIGPLETDCFALNRHRLRSGALLALAAPAVYVITEGEGALLGPAGYWQGLKKGEYFFLPACSADQYGVSGDSLEMIECLPPALQYYSGI